ncbi:MAG: SEC-C domain-containing protein [Desulfovibrio sp.]|jgi:hypothetical protein|nr:SEC-C domain-containing protein [Desulfovibrio sp.]
MTKIGRNAPCPCGSGKKYKQCCLDRETAYQQLLQEQRDAKLRAVSRLEDKYGDAVNEAAALYFFQSKENDMQARIAELSENMQLAVLACLHDWLIADARLMLNGEWVQASDLLLGPGGPLFTTAGRRHIEELAASELSLYEVLEVHKGKGLLLRDLIRTNENPAFVHEVTATKMLVVWDTLGARILRRDGMCALGGGVYPFTREHGKILAEFLAKTVRKGVAKKYPKATAREIITCCIINAWLERITAPPSIPILLDARTNEPLLFTTDRYRVSDWRALQDILNAQDEVEREDENVWTRAERVNERQYRSLARLERLPSGMLEMECRTEGSADEARAWLEKLAGPYVSHTDRETEDPRETLLDESEVRPRAKQAESTNAVPLEVQQQIMSEYFDEHYKSWPAMSLPALNGKTPLQAVRLKNYRPKVVELLKQIENGEAKRAGETGLPPFDIAFLWERLGLTRE